MRGWEMPLPAPQLSLLPKWQKYKVPTIPRAGTLFLPRMSSMKRAILSLQQPFLARPRSPRKAAIKGRVTMNSTFQWESIRCWGAQGGAASLEGCGPPRDLGGMQVPRGFKRMLVP